MQNTKRNNREQNAIDSAMRGLEDISKGIAIDLRTVGDTERYLKDLFTYGMRLSKYRAQIANIKEQTAEIKQHKKEAINNIDAVLEVVLCNAEKTFNVLKEIKK